MGQRTAAERTRTPPNEGTGPAGISACRAVVVRQAAGGAVAGGVRLASLGGQTQRAAAIPDQHRRPEHPLLPRAIRARRCLSPTAVARLAEYLVRVLPLDRHPHRSWLNLTVTAQSPRT